MGGSVAILWRSLSNDISNIRPLLIGVERVGVPLAESSYFATFADSSCCVALSASVLALLAKKIQKVTIMFALFQHVQLFEC